MQLTSVYRSPQENYKTASPIPLLPKSLSVDHPNPRSSLSKLPLVAPYPRKSSTSNKTAEGGSVASAKAGVKEVVPVVQPSEEHLIILRLKNILAIRPDQTVLQVSQC
jgi:hypothetical protein